MTSDSNGRAVGGTFPIEAGPEPSRRRHVAADLQTLARLAADFARGVMPDANNKNGGRPNEVVLWYHHRGVTLVIDELTGRDFVLCSLGASEQYAALEALKVSEMAGRAMCHDAALNVLNSRLYGCTAGKAAAWMAGRPGCAVQFTSWSMTVPYWDAYAETFEMHVGVRLVAVDRETRYVISPLAGELARVRRAAAKWIFNTLCLELAHHDAENMVAVLHGHP